jgi:predicted O-methyltransferase YrrM
MLRLKQESPASLRERVLSILVRLRLPWLLKRLVSAASPALREWYEQQRIRYRSRTRLVLVETRELQDVQRQALQLLKARTGSAALGDYLEFGVYNGTSLLCMQNVTTELGFERMRLFGFDSFEGLPAEAATDDEGYWEPGDFCTDYALARAVLTEEGADWSRIHLVKGWFCDTLTHDLVRQHDIRKASVIMIDCDMHLSAKQALDFSGPLIRDHAVIIFDDWYAGDLAAKCLGERLAFAEFLAENPCFTFEEMGGYPPYGHVVLVTRNSAPTPQT